MPPSINLLQLLGDFLAEINHHRGLYDKLKQTQAVYATTAAAAASSSPAAAQLQAGDQVGGGGQAAADRKLQFNGVLPQLQLQLQHVYAFICILLSIESKCLQVSSRRSVHHAPQQQSSLLPHHRCIAAAAAAVSYSAGAVLS
jgi:hypothetical protein